MNERPAAPPRPSWPWPWALGIGALAFAWSCVWQAPRLEPWSMGLDFAAMAADPLGGHGPFPHRVLGPCIAWLLGLHGERYALFAHGTAVVFLAMVAAVARRHGASLAGAVLLTAVVATTGAVEVYKHHVGYAEPLAFALALGAHQLRRHTGWFWLAMWLGLLNHEGIAFVWPWLLWAKWRDAGLARGDAVGAAAALGVYLTIRWSLLAAASQPTLSAAVYFANLPTATTAAMWVIAAASIPIYFGVLPVLLAWHARASDWRRAALPLLLVLAPILAMCTVATDMPRFLGWLALPIVFAGVWLLHRPNGARWLLALGAATLLAIVLQRGVVGVIVDGMMRRYPEPLPGVVVDLWPLFAAYGAALAAMVAAGRWLARRAPAAHAPS